MAGVTVWSFPPLSLPPSPTGTPRRHMCKAAPHVIHLFSFSKAFGMMGWRVGYIAYPKENPGQGVSDGYGIIYCFTFLPYDCL